MTWTTFVTLLAVWMGFRVQYPPGPDGVEPVARLVAQRALGAGDWTPANLYTMPLATAPAPGSRPPGSIDSLWLSISEDPSYWRKGGWRLRIGAVSAAGDSGAWSNWAIAAAGVPRDTCFFDVSAAGGAVRSTPNALKPTIYEVRFVRAESETTSVLEAGWLAGRGPLMHQEDLEIALRCPICSIYHYLAVRGVRDSSACRAPMVCP